MPPKNKEAQRAYLKKYNANPARKADIKQRSWKRLYGITKEEYDAMLMAQGHVCEICKRPETMKRNGVPRMLCVDHNHETKKVRALLCAYCNIAVGYLGEDPLRAQALTDYLIKHQS
jgi:hypothetical protein